MRRVHSLAAGNLPRLRSTRSGWRRPRATHDHASRSQNRGVEIDTASPTVPIAYPRPGDHGVAVRMAVLYLLAGGKPELADAAKRGAVPPPD